jgi:hypothetical protein
LGASVALAAGAGAVVAGAGAVGAHAASARLNAAMMAPKGVDFRM